MLHLIGIVVFAGTFGGMLWANSRRWRYLAQSYTGSIRRSRAERHMQSAVLVGLGAYNSLKGIVTIGIHDDGISLRIMPPFSLFHAPLFIPFSDIQGWGTTWYLDAHSSELQLVRAPHVKVIMPTEQVHWIRSFSGSQLALHSADPPNGRAGRGWHAVAVASAGLSLAAITWLCVHLVSGPTLWN